MKVRTNHSRRIVFEKLRCVYHSETYVGDSSVELEIPV